MRQTVLYGIQVEAEETTDKQNDRKLTGKRTERRASTVSPAEVS
jgi:hypothetical protein